MDHPSLAYLHGEADSMDLEASRIEQAIAAGDASNMIASACLARAPSRVMPLLEEERATLSAALWEHDAAQPALRKEAATRDAIEADAEAIAAALAAGEDCSGPLERYASSLHRYADIERNEIAATANAAGERVLAEADARVRNYGQAETPVAVDWSRLT